MPDSLHVTSILARASVFAGADVCHTAGLALLPGASRPVFEHDVWNLTGLADAHRGLRPHARVFDFTPIINPAWRTVAKELLLALLAPRHEQVLRLPTAFCSPRGPQTHQAIPGLPPATGWRRSCSGTRSPSAPTVRRWPARSAQAPTCTSTLSTSPPRRTAATRPPPG